MSRAENGVRDDKSLAYDTASPATYGREKRSFTGKTSGGIFGYHILEPKGSSYWTLLKAVAAETLGTAMFVFLATAVVTSGCHTADVAAQSGNGGDTSLTNVEPGSCFLSQTSTLLNIALGFGFSIFVVIYFTASFSGGHINPAVTLAMFLTRKISFLRGILYIAVQCGGAACGSIVLKGLDPKGFTAAGGASNRVNHQTGTTVGTALGFEVVLTFALVFTIFAATDSERALSTAPLPILAPYSIGMVVFVCHLVGIPIDGTSINPARSFGPAVVARQFDNFWVFWVGPFAGAIAASCIYELVFKSWKISTRADPVHADQDVEAGIPVAPTATRPAERSSATGLQQRAVPEPGTAAAGLA